MNRLVVVEWEDAWTDGHWIEEEPTATPEVVQTVGMVIVENEEGILLAQTYSKGQFGNLWFIPNGMINSVKYLKEGGDA